MGFWPFGSREKVEVWAEMAKVLAGMVPWMGKAALKAFPGDARGVLFELLLYEVLQTDLRAFTQGESQQARDHILQHLDPVVKTWHLGPATYLAIFDERSAGYYGPIVREVGGQEQFTRLYRALFLLCDSACQSGKHEVRPPIYVSGDFVTNMEREMVFIGTFSTIDGVWGRWVIEALKEFPGGQQVPKARWEAFFQRTERLVASLIKEAESRRL